MVSKKYNTNVFVFGTVPSTLLVLDVTSKYFVSIVKDARTYLEDRLIRLIREKYLMSDNYSKGACSHSSNSYSYCITFSSVKAPRARGRGHLKLYQQIAENAFVTDMFQLS